MKKSKEKGCYENTLDFLEDPVFQRIALECKVFLYFMLFKCSQKYQDPGTGQTIRAVKNQSRFLSYERPHAGFMRSNELKSTFMTSNQNALFRKSIVSTICLYSFI